MNRREFIGASLAGIIAAIALRFDEFASWWHQWLGEPKRLLETSETTLESFAALMKELYADTGVQELVYGESPFFRMLAVSA